MMSPRATVTPTQLGNHIIRRRKSKGWTTAELARSANLSYSTVRNIEKGFSRKPEEAILLAISAALECNDEVVLTYAGYGKMPQYTPEEMSVNLAALGEVAPLWREAIQAIAEMTPEEQNQAYAVLMAQLDAARRRRSGHQ